MRTCRGCDFFSATADLQPLCIKCGTGRCDEHKTLVCIGCGEHHHRFCLGLSETVEIDEASWRCSECTNCEVCKRGHDDAHLLLCDCGKAFHTYCLRPPLKTVPTGEWRCPSCITNVKCERCHTQRPGLGGWKLGYRFCGKCFALHEKQGYCVVCYNECLEEEEPMVCCDVCNFWVHIECDGISDRGADFLAAKGDRAPYKCPRCTGEPPGAYGERLEKELPTAGKFGIAALEKQRAKREQHAFAAEAAAAAALAATDPNTLGVAAPEAMDADAPPASNGARKRGRPGKQRTPTDDAPDGKRSRVSPGDAVDAQALVPKLQPHSPPVVSSPARAPVLAQPAIPNAAVLAQPMAPVLAQPPNLPPVGYPGHPGADPMLLQTLAALGVPQHAPKAPFV